MNYTAPITRKAKFDTLRIFLQKKAPVEVAIFIGRCFRDAVDNYYCTGAFMTAYLLSSVESSSITMADVGPSHSGYVSLLLR
jgi:uncharacterized membrane protein YobD (UPF0266 family)